MAGMTRAVLKEVSEDPLEIRNSLSPRLQDVLDALTTSGQSEKEIARTLGLSRHTVHDYVKDLFARFDVRTRPELTALLLPAPNTSRQNDEVSSVSVADANEQVNYCVNLLRERGFIIRSAELAEDLMRNRKGFVVLSLLLVLAAGPAVFLHDRISRASLEADVSGFTRPPAPEVLLPDEPIYPRRLEVLPRISGEWTAAGRVQHHDHVGWEGPDGSEVRIGHEKLMPGRHVMYKAGMLYVRSGTGRDDVVVKITIDRPFRQQSSEPAQAE